MASQTRPIETRRYPWARGGFDLEGWIAAIAALFVGLLLGWIWSPLFLLGLAAAVVAMLASRHSPRTAPLEDGIVVAPVDAVVHSVREGVPPTALGLEQTSGLRVRLSSAPFVQNRVLAPLSGTVSTLRRPGTTGISRCTKTSCTNRSAPRAASIKARQRRVSPESASVCPAARKTNPKASLTGL